MPDMIEHKKNGYLAIPYKEEDFAAGIAWMLDDETRLQELSHRAREKVEQEFELLSIARRYEALYNEIIATQV
jgi:glycosyltransferase involved in cell wall biosynthesis